MLETSVEFSESIAFSIKFPSTVIKTSDGILVSFSSSELDESNAKWIPSSDALANFPIKRAAIDGILICLIMVLIISFVPY